MNLKKKDEYIPKMRRTNINKTYKRDPYICKETYKYKKRPENIKGDLQI